MSDTRRHAHQLIDRMPEAQLNGLVRFLETIGAPGVAFEDEEITEEEERAVAEAREWLKHNKPMPHEDVLAEFGLTMVDWERMSRTAAAGREERLLAAKDNGLEDYLDRPGQADVRAIDRETALDLLQRLARFLETEQGDVKHLQDIDPPEYRLRIGDYVFATATAASPSRFCACSTAKTPTGKLA